MGKVGFKISKQITHIISSNCTYYSKCSPNCPARFICHINVDNLDAINATPWGHTDDAYAHANFRNDFAVL